MNGKRWIPLEVQSIFIKSLLQYDLFSLYFISFPDYIEYVVTSTRFLYIVYVVLFVESPTDTYTADMINNPDRQVHGANMGPTWVLSAPDGPHVGPMNLAIREYFDTMQRRMF